MDPPNANPTSDFANEPLPGIPGVYFHDNVTLEWWHKNVEHLTAKEKERCDVWKDEVQTNLIFAGLFSAVVTAFIVESYQSLQDDPSEVLLARIVTALEQGTNSTEPEFAPQALDPATASNKLVNALWFLSLVLSLASALIGLVALQWLREHLRTTTRNFPLKRLPAMIQMQSEALDAFYVPQIFTALPLLLITALVLFFIGVIQFLWNINRVVAYPSIIAASFTLSFILYTTLRPGLQGLPFIGIPRRHIHGSSPMPSTPCPYRSPQSWACLQAIVFISSSINIFFGRIHPAFGLKYPNFSDWVSWSSHWPRLRDISFLRSVLRDPQSPLVQAICDPKLDFSPIYDTLQALIQVRRDFTLMADRKYDEASLHALNVFNNFLFFNTGAAAQGFGLQLLDIVHDALIEPGLPLCLPRAVFAGATPLIKRYHANLVFALAGVTSLNEIAMINSGYIGSSIPNMLLFACEKLGEKIPKLNRYHGSPIIVSWAFSTRYHFTADKKGDVMLKQFLEIVKRTFQYASEARIDDDTPTLGTSPFVKINLHAIANIVVSRVHPPAARLVNQENDLVLTSLDDYLSAQTKPNPYLHLLASIYAHFLLVALPRRFVWKPAYKRSDAFNKITATLKQQHSLILNDARLRQYQEWIFPESLNPDFTWAYLDPQYDRIVESTWPCGCGECRQKKCATKVTKGSNGQRGKNVEHENLPENKERGGVKGVGRCGSENGSASSPAPNFDIAATPDASSQPIYAVYPPPSKIRRLVSDAASSTNGFDAPLNGRESSFMSDLDVDSLDPNVLEVPGRTYSSGHHRRSSSTSSENTSQRFNLAAEPYSSREASLTAQEEKLGPRKQEELTDDGSAGSIDIVIDMTIPESPTNM